MMEEKPGLLLERKIERWEKKKTTTTSEVTLAESDSLRKFSEVRKNGRGKQQEFSVQR